MKFRSMIVAGSVAFSMLPAAQSIAQQIEVLTANQLRQMGGTLPTLVSGPPSTGKERFFARGIQGEIRIAGVVGIDGAFHDASIALSSRSSELDSFALDLIAKSKFEPAKDNMGVAVPVKATIPVHLWKDSLTDGSIFSKRCEDFVIDADWHSSVFPEERPDQLRSWLLISGGTLAYRLGNGSRKEAIPNFQAVYDACHKKPSRKFADVFLGK